MSSLSVAVLLLRRRLILDFAKLLVLGSGVDVGVVSVSIGLWVALRMDSLISLRLADDSSSISDKSWVELLCSSELDRSSTSGDWGPRFPLGALLLINVSKKLKYSAR